MGSPTLMHEGVAKFSLDIYVDNWAKQLNYLPYACGFEYIPAKRRRNKKTFDRQPADKYVPSPDSSFHF